MHVIGDKQIPKMILFQSKKQIELINIEFYISVMEVGI